MKIAVFQHALLFLGDPPRLLPAGLRIVNQQLRLLETTGLMDACDHHVVGLNGGKESLGVMRWNEKTKVILHGLESRAENLTLVALEQWLPGHEDWYVLYFHCKGATHPPGDYSDFNTRWRNCMTKHCIENWKTCVADLDGGVESCGCHWMTGLADGTQNIWAGNFWWAKASFLLTLPSIFLRDRIKVSGIADVESRYESEVWIGNGPRLPTVKDYHLNGLGGCP